MKRCWACSEAKPLREFGSNRSTRDGLKGSCRSCSNELTKAWRRKNRKRWLTYNRRNVNEWRKKNPERLLAQVAKRNQRLRDLPGGCFRRSRPDYLARVAYYGCLCAYCGDPYEVLDHAIPISRGGTNHAANIRPACQACNLSKHAKTPAEFAVWLAKNKPLHGRR